MLKITVKPLVGKASKYEFEKVSDALVFLKSIESNEQTRAAELKRAPVQSEQKCPRCKGTGITYINTFDYVCPLCKGMGISKRSDGG